MHVNSSFKERWARINFIFRWGATRKLILILCARNEVTMSQKLNFKLQDDFFHIIYPCPHANQIGSSVSLNLQRLIRKSVVGGADI